MSDVGLFLVMFAGLLLMLGVIRFLAWLTELQNTHGSLGRAGLHTVKRYIAVERPVMAREDDGPAVSLPSSLETDARRTPDAPAPPKMKAEELLTVYTLMRAYGIKREEAQAACTASGLPFNNNVWTRAAPPEDEHITPIVGRQTSARFEQTDTDYPYQKLT